MAQNISLDKSSQSTFTKAVKNIKKLFKKNELDSGDAAKTKGKKAVLGKGKGPVPQDSKPIWKQHGKGVVYLSHIPEGFYEKEMHSYFSQFGRVTRLNLVRSRKNGNPKGFAFIEFLYSEVAQVVAETMNNYLMCNRLLKAEYIPGERIRRGMFKNSYIRPENCPRSKSQKKWIKKTNKKLTLEEEAGAILRETKRLDKLKKQLKDSGIHLDCQVEGSPLALLNSNEFETVGNPVLQIDESDDEIEFKLQPNVIRVVKRKSSSTSNLSPSIMKRKTERAVKRKSLSTSMLSPNVKTLKTKAKKINASTKAFEAK